MWILFILVMTSSGQSESRWQGFDSLAQCEAAKDRERPVLTDGTPAEVWSIGCQPLSRH